MPSAGTVALVSMILALFATARSGPMAAPVGSRSFVNSVGVNVHLTYYNSPYGTLGSCSGSPVKCTGPGTFSALQALGIKSIRDGMMQSDTNNQWRYEWLSVNLGISTDLVDDGHAGTPQPDSATRSYIRLLQSGSAYDAVTRSSVKSPHVLNAVECLNEEDHNDNAGFPRDDAWVMYNIVWPATQATGIAAYGCSLENEGSIPQLAGGAKAADLPTETAWSSIETYANAHNYAQTYPEDPNGNNVGAIKAAAHYFTGDRVSRVVDTENGWNTAGGSTLYVDRATQMKYDSRLLLYNFSIGIPRTYLYELFDMGPGNGPFDAMGLYDGSGNVKPSGRMIGTLIGLLADSGTPKLVDQPLTVTGGGPYLHSFLLQNSSRRYFLPIWLAEASWNFSTHSEITIRPETVTIHDAKLLTATLVTFNASGVESARALRPSGGGAVTFSVTDTPAIFEFTAAP